MIIRVLQSPLLILCLAEGSILSQGKPAESSTADPFLEMARPGGSKLSGDLPKFVCQEVNTRFYKKAGDGSWRQQDVISAEVAYDSKTGESYRDLRLNGSPTASDILALPGSSSEGQFALDLQNLFASSDDKDYRFVEETDLNGSIARVYDYTVDRAASNWKVKEGSLTVTPAYSGRIWIDKTRGRVVRLEMSANALPVSFATDRICIDIDYGPVRLSGGVIYFLPIRAEALFCRRRQQSCNRNVIEFRHYREFDVESAITFTDPLVELGLTPGAPPFRATEHRTTTKSRLTFAGVVRVTSSRNIVLELDDTRYFIVSRREDKAAHVTDGDRVQVESSEYDGRGLVPDSIIVMRAPVQAHSLISETTPRQLKTDASIEQARKAETDLLRALPNFLCTERVKRYETWPGTRGGNCKTNSRLKFYAAAPQAKTTEISGLMASQPTNSGLN